MSIYRVRPANAKTVEELREPYLWFSKPSGFAGDEYDANIEAFVQSCDLLRSALNQGLNDLGIRKLYEKSKDVGICCFTRMLPNSPRVLQHFPSKKCSVVVEFDEKKMCDYFCGHYYLKRSFLDVVYCQQPLKFEMESGIICIRENIGADGFRLLNVNSELKQDFQKGLEKIYRLLLSRLSSTFKKQQEARIVLARPDLYKLASIGNGYKVLIPHNLITAVYVPHSNTAFYEQLDGIAELKKKLHTLPW